MDATETREGLKPMHVRMKDAIITDSYDHTSPAASPPITTVRMISRALPSPTHLSWRIMSAGGAGGSTGRGEPLPAQRGVKREKRMPRRKRAA